MMTAKSCQCQIPRQPNVAGRLGSWHSRNLSGEGPDTSKQTFNVDVDNDHNFFVPYKTLPAYDTADSAHFKDGTPLGSVSAGTPYVALAYAYLMHSDGNTTSPNDWDSLVALLDSPDGSGPLGWVETAYFYQDKDGNEFAAKYGHGQADKTPMSAAEIQKGLANASDADDAISYAKQEFKDSQGAGGGAGAGAGAGADGKGGKDGKDGKGGGSSGGGWSISFGDSGSGAKDGGAGSGAGAGAKDGGAGSGAGAKDGGGAKGGKAAAGGGMGLAVGLGALALLLAGKK